MKIPLVCEMAQVAFDSAKNLREEISNVKHSGFSSGFEHELISFDFQGQRYLGKLVGRNRDLCLGFSPEQDKGIAARVLLDGDARENAFGFLDD
jgi:hypothetical protein